MMQRLLGAMLVIDTLLPDDSVVLVIRVISIVKLSVLSKLKFQKLVPKFPLVTYLVPHIELAIVIGHDHSLLTDTNEPKRKCCRPLWEWMIKP
jgi:hypothetical protein